MGTSTDVLHSEIARLKAQIRLLKKYQRGYHILEGYFDSIADEEKPEVDKQLSKLGL